MGLKTYRPLGRTNPPKKIAEWKQGQIPERKKIDTASLDYGVVPRVREEIKPHDDLAPRKGYTRCEWCGMDINIKDHKQDPHHLIPVSAGGPDHELNLMMLCGPRAEWGCHFEAQNGKISLVNLADRHAILFPEIRDGVHLLEEINKMRTHVKKGA